MANTIKEKEKRTARLSVSITPTKKAAIEELASKSRMSVADMIGVLIDNALTKNGIMGNADQLKSNKRAAQEAFKSKTFGITGGDGGSAD